MLIASILFFLAGLAFGYAAPGRARFLPLLFPLALALGALSRDGLTGGLIVRLVIALAVTGLGIAAGAALDERSRREAAV
jgi:hypothetical protein